MAKKKSRKPLEKISYLRMHVPSGKVRVVRSFVDALIISSQQSSFGLWTVEDLTDWWNKMHPDTWHYVPLDTGKITTALDIEY